MVVRSEAEGEVDSLLVSRTTFDAFVCGEGTDVLTALGVDYLCRRWETEEAEEENG